VASVERHAARFRSCGIIMPEQTCENVPPAADRVSRIQSWLEKHRDEINGLRKGDLVFNFGGCRLSGKVTQVHEEV